MSTAQQLGLIGNSVKVQSLPTASAETFGAGNRFYTLIGQQEGYITGHTYRTVVANDVYSWEDVACGNYNMLDNIPVINQDLSASGFTPVANTYYRHTGATTDTFTQGVIYLYDTAYHKLGESSGGGTTLNEYTYSANLINSTSTMRSTILHIAKKARNYIASIRLDVGLSNETNNTFRGEVYIGGDYYAYSGILKSNDTNMALVYIINNGNSINILGYLIKDGNLLRVTSNTYAMLNIIYYNDAEIT